MAAEGGEPDGPPGAAGDPAAARQLPQLKEETLAGLENCAARMALYEVGKVRALARWPHASELSGQE